MSDINNNFGKFFNAQQKLNAYNDYKKLSSKAKKNNEELRNAADINGDGKINTKDRTAANKEIKELKKDELLFDVNSDGKVDLNDLIMISNGFDIDGDGNVSKKELKFLQEQEKTLIEQLDNNLDLNGDGEVNLNDLENLTNWIEERDSYNSKDQVDTFLQKIQKNLNKTLGLTNLKTLAQTQEKLDKTNYFMEGRYDITANDNLDADGNGTIDANDAKLFGLASKSLQQQLKVNVDDINSAKINYDTALAEKPDLVTKKKEAKTLKDNLKKELDSANNAVKTANRNISNYERSLATAQKNLERAKTDANKAIYQKKVDTYQAKLNAEKEKLQTAQATQAEKQTAYDAAKANYDTLSADLKENNSAKTAYNKYSAYYKNYGDFEIKDVDIVKVPVGDIEVKEPGEELVSSGGVDGNGMPVGDKIDVPKMGSVDELAQLLGTSPDKMNITETVDMSEEGVYRLKFTVDQGYGMQTSYAVDWINDEFSVYALDDAGNAIAVKQYDANGQLVHSWSAGIKIGPIDLDPVIINPGEIVDIPEVGSGEYMAKLTGVDIENMTDVEYGADGNITSFNTADAKYSVDYHANGEFVIEKDSIYGLLTKTVYDANGNVRGEYKAVSVKSYPVTDENGEPRLDENGNVLVYTEIIWEPVIKVITEPSEPEPVVNPGGVDGNGMPVGDKIEVPPMGSVDALAELLGTSADKMNITDIVDWAGEGVYRMKFTVDQGDGTQTSYAVDWINDEFAVYALDDAGNAIATKRYDINNGQLTYDWNSGIYVNVPVEPMPINPVDPMPLPLPKIELPADSITVPKEGSIEGLAKMYGVSADEIQVHERSGIYGVNTKIIFTLPFPQPCDEPTSTFTAQWVDGKFFVTLAEGGMNKNATTETKCYDENGNVFGTSKTTNPKEGASDLGYGAVDISDTKVGSLDFVTKLAGLNEYQLSSSAIVKRDEQGRIVSWKQTSLGMLMVVPDFEVKVNYNDDGTYTVSIIDGNGRYNDKNTTINTYNSKGDLIQQSEQKLLAQEKFHKIQMLLDKEPTEGIEPWLGEDNQFIEENENMINQNDLIKATDLYTKYKAGTISSQSLFSNLDKDEDEEI